MEKVRLVGYGSQLVQRTEAEAHGRLSSGGFLMQKTVATTTHCDSCTISWNHRSHCVAGGCIDSFMLFTWASEVRPTRIMRVLRTLQSSPPGSSVSPDQVPGLVPVRGILCRISCCAVVRSRERTMLGSTKVASSCRRSACMQDT